MNNKQQRYKLDNAAILYASIMSKKRRPIFRFSAVLTEKVDPELLTKALKKTADRFPYFTVRLKSGFFWYYFEESDYKTEPEKEYINTFAPKKYIKNLFRVQYSDSKIILDLDHVLGDGFGGMIFLKTLLSQYFILKGIDVPALNGILDVNEKALPEEFEDSYPKYCRKPALSFWKEAKAYHPDGTALMPGQVAIITGVMDTNKVLEKAHTYGVSITEYLASILLYALYLYQRNRELKKHYPIKICITSDLRKYYNSKTLRIFSGYRNPGIDPNLGEYTFKEILTQIHHQCRFLFTEKNLNNLISRNVSFEKSFFINITPLLLKTKLIKAAHYFFGEQLISTNLTNMGSVELPEAIRDKVKSLYTMGGNLDRIKIECGVISYYDKLTVSFTRIIKQSFIDDCFFEMLTREGIQVERDSYSEKFEL